MSRRTIHQHPKEPTVAAIRPTDHLSWASSTNLAALPAALVRKHLWLEIQTAVLFHCMEIIDQSVWVLQVVFLIQW